MDNNKQIGVVQSGKAVVSANGKRVYKKTEKETWAAAKSDYESGLYTLDELSDKYIITVTNIKKHKARHKWQKGKDLAVMESNIAEKNRRLFEKHGMSASKHTKLITEGMLEPKTIVFEGKGEAMQATTQPDYDTILKYAQEYSKLTGNYIKGADGEKSKEGDKHLHLHLQPPKDATPQQSLAGYLSLIRGETG